MNDRVYQISRPVMPAVDGMLPELREILESGQLTNGERVRRLEAAAKAYVGGDAEVVGMSSNTTGMMLAWRGMDLEGVDDAAGSTSSAALPNAR